MAEPARKLHPEIEPNIHPRFGVIQGGGESTPERGDLQSVGDNSTAQDLSDQERRFGVIQGGGESTPERGDLRDASSNINDARNQEEAPWKTNVSGNSGNNKSKLQLKGNLKKKGPLGLILTLLLGGGGGLSFLFSPGMLIVDLKERMVDKFDDQLAAMDVRTTSMIKKKFAGTTSGVCGSKITIRCKYNTMSKRQFNRLEKAIVAEGGKINTDGKTLIKGRNKIESIEFNGKTIKASNFATELKSNPAFRAAMIKGYNPKLAGFADSLFSKLSAKLGITKTKNIGADEGKEKTGTADETKTKEQTMREELTKATSGEAAIEASTGVKTTEKACDSGDDCVDGKRTVYTDADGKTLSKADYDARVGKSSVLKAELAARKSLTDVGKKATKATLKGALTSTALGLGAVDTACTGYMLIRTVGFAAKYLGALQLLRYAHVFMNTADSIKAGDATPDQVEYIGNILTSQNAVGMSATDSYGYKYVAYGDSNDMPRTEDVSAESKDQYGNNVQLTDAQKEKVLINDETTRYINGQLVTDNILSTLIRASGDVSSTTTDAMDNTCKFVKSGWGQAIIIGTAVVGAVVAFFSGGASLTWGAAVQGAVSVAISVALAMLTPKLIDMAAGTVIKGDENGNEAGNAITSGMESYNDQTSQARGIPVLQQADAVAYADLTAETIAQYDAVDRLQYSPLDPTNSNTFMGSLISKIVPYTTKMSSLTGGISAMSQFATSSFASVLPNANAVDPSAQYKICKDRDYKDLKLAVGPFCGPRHGLKASTLDIDQDIVLDYMENNNYIEKDSENNKPKDPDNDYAKYIKNCMDRSVSVGGYVSEEDTNKGEECIQGNHSGDEEYKYNMFRLFYIDQSIDDGMENGEAGASTSSESSNGTVVSPIASPTVTSGYGPRGDITNATKASKWHAALDLVGNPTDIVAAMAGTVESVQGNGVNAVIIKHADGLRTRYLHMWPKDTLVKVGDTVTAGQKIGVVGCAGKDDDLCGGDHLDFSVWIDGVTDATKYSKYKTAPTDAGGASGKAINPANFLKDNGVSGYDGAVNEN